MSLSFLLYAIIEARLWGQTILGHSSNVVHWDLFTTACAVGFVEK
jgi:hypothetical protein